MKTLYYNNWLLRFDGRGRCVEFVEYFMAERACWLRRSCVSGSWAVRFTAPAAVWAWLAAASAISRAFFMKLTSPSLPSGTGRRH